MSTDLRSLMQQAWSEARRASQAFGGRPSEYLAAALRDAWGDRRAALGINVARMTDNDLAGFHTHLAGALAHIEAAPRLNEARADAVRLSQSAVADEMSRRFRINSGCAAWNETTCPAEWVTAAHGFKPAGPSLSTAWGVVGAAAS